MRLTAEQLARGLLHWDAVTPLGSSIEVFTATWDGPDPTSDATLEWCGPHIHPAGSPVMSPKRSRLTARIDMNTTDSTKTPQLSALRWETDEGVRVMWGDSVAYMSVARRPGYACSLTVSPRAASWTNSGAVFDLLNHLRVRFIDGEVRGTQIQPFTQMKVDEVTGAISLAGGGSPLERLTGQYIQVHSTVDNPALSYHEGVGLARANCLAVLELLALVCGEQVVGQIVLEDEVAAGPNGEEGVDRVPVTALYPRKVEDAQVDEIDRALPRAVSGSDTNSFDRALHLALRWYLRLVTTDAPLDQFTAAFLAVDSLCNSYQDSFPLTEQRPSLVKFLGLVTAAREAGIEVDHEMESAVGSLLGTLPLAGKFRRLRESCGGTSEAIAQDFQLFRTAQKIRNEIVHGGRSNVTYEEAAEVRELLEKILAASLNLALPSPFQRFTRFLQSTCERLSDDVRGSLDSHGLRERKSWWRGTGQRVAHTLWWVRRRR